MTYVALASIHAYDRKAVRYTLIPTVQMAKGKLAATPFQLMDAVKAEVSTVAPMQDPSVSATAIALYSTVTGTLQLSAADVTRLRTTIGNP